MMKENFLAALMRQPLSSYVIWLVTDKNHLSVTSVIDLHQLCSSFNFKKEIIKWGEKKTFIIGLPWVTWPWVGGSGSSVVDNLNLSDVISRSSLRCLF